MILDTCFLIDLHRELAGRPARGARAFLEHHPDTPFAISAITAVEFLEGFADERRGTRFLDPFRILPLDAAVAVHAARIRRQLRRQGAPIGDMDILIAATALHSRIPLVSHNLSHFQRISGLECIGYREG